MSETCEGCRFRAKLRFGDFDGEFCTGAPPTAVTTVNPEASTMTVNAVYPPIPSHRCGRYEAKPAAAWWYRCVLWCLR